MKDWALRSVYCAFSTFGRSEDAVASLGEASMVSGPSPPAQEEPSDEEGLRPLQRLPEASGARGHGERRGS